MNLDTTQTLLRSVLKIGGGILLANGWMDESQAEAIIGGLLALLAVIWGVWHRKQGAANQTTSAVRLIGPIGWIGFLTGCAMLLGACHTDRLELGGAYAPAETNVTAGTDGGVTTNVISTAAPDIAFFQVDSAFLLAHSAIDTVFALERNNRQLLWQISPEIKHTLDRLRPEAVKIVRDYALARSVYKANPTPTGLSTLEEILSRANQVSAALQAVIPAQR